MSDLMLDEEKRQLLAKVADLQLLVKNQVGVITSLEKSKAEAENKLHKLEIELAYLERYVRTIFTGISKGNS